MTYKKVKYNGKYYTFPQLSEMTGVEEKNLRQGHKRNWSMDYTVDFFMQEQAGFPGITEITKLEGWGYVIPYKGRCYQIRELIELLDIHVDRGTISDYIKKKDCKTFDDLMRAIGPAEEKARKKEAAKVDTDAEEVRYTRAWFFDWFREKFRVGDMVRLNVLVADGDERRSMRLELMDYTDKLAVFRRQGAGSVCFSFWDLYNMT